MKKKTTRIQEFETLAVLAMFLLLVGMVTSRWIFVGLALVLLAIAMFAERVAGVVARIWLRFAEVIALINNRVLLTLLYFAVLTPLAVIYRLFHADSLALHTKNNASLYTERNHSYCEDDLKNMW